MFLHRYTILKYTFVYCIHDTRFAHPNSKKVLASYWSTEAVLECTASVESKSLDTNGSHSSFLNVHRVISPCIRNHSATEIECNIVWGNQASQFAQYQSGYLPFSLSLSHQLPLSHKSTSQLITVLAGENIKAWSGLLKKTLSFEARRE